MADETTTTDETTESAPESFTTESTTDSFSTATPREIVTAPGAATGRRKEAIARVRVRPNEAEGEGTITVNGRELADYFPSKTHQMILTEPLRATELTEARL